MNTRCHPLSTHCICGWILHSYVSLPLLLAVIGMFLSPSSLLNQPLSDLQTHPSSSIAPPLPQRLFDFRMSANLPQSSRDWWHQRFWHKVLRSNGNLDAYLKPYWAHHSTPLHRIERESCLISCTHQMHTLYYCILKICASYAMSAKPFWAHRPAHFHNIKYDSSVICT